MRGKWSFTVLLLWALGVSQVPLGCVADRQQSNPPSSLQQGEQHRSRFPPRGPDGRVQLGEKLEGQLARGEAALNELADIERSSKQVDREELAWSRFFLTNSLAFGNAADGRLVADALANTKADPARRLAAALTVTHALTLMYPPEPPPEDEPSAVEVRAYLAPFWRPIADARDALLAAGAAADVNGVVGNGEREAEEQAADADRVKAARMVRTASLLAATDAGDAATFARALEIAGDDGELHARIVELAARHEPRLLSNNEAEMRATVDRLRAHLAARGPDKDDAVAMAVAEAVAAIGPPAASLAEDLVRLPSDLPAVGEMIEYDLDDSVGMAMELIGPDAAPYVLPLLKDADPGLRRRAVEALLNVYSTFPFHHEERRPAPREVIEAVRPLSNDLDEQVRQAAESAVWEWESDRPDEND